MKERKSSSESLIDDVKKLSASSQDRNWRFSFSSSVNEADSLWASFDSSLLLGDAEKLPSLCLRRSEGDALTPGTYILGVGERGRFVVVVVVVVAVENLFEGKEAMA